jgi:RNA polymerase sigma-70 factor (ECF subfamily)
VTASASDAELLAESIREPAVFGEIFDRHADTMLRFFVRRVGQDAAEGLLGEVFRLAFERRHVYDRERSNARPWLYGIATNLLRNHRRAEARRLRFVARFAAERKQAEPIQEGAAEARTLLPRVSEALEALPAGERDALLLFAWEELDYQQIAAALEIPVGTVRSRINRARRKLREQIEEKGLR